MPSVYDIKPQFQNLLRPLTRGLARAGVTANAVTLLAAALSVALGVGLGIIGGNAGDVHGHPRIWLAVPLWLFVRMALNAIDGMLAREHRQQSKLGAVLNELGDVVADAALYLPFALWIVEATWWTGTSLPVVLIVVLAGLSEMTGVVATQIGAPRGYQGPMGKSDRALVFGVLALARGLGAVPGAWCVVALWVVAVLLALTIVNRARVALKIAGAQHE